MQSLSPNDLVRRGCIQVMEGRHCFGHLSVEDNLMTGAFTRRDGNAAIRDDLDLVYHYFPRLKVQAHQPGRLHLRRRTADDGDRPGADVAAQDDPARRAVDGAGAATGRGDLRDRQEAQRGAGRVFLLAEQNTNVALRFAKYGYILESGRIVLDGEAQALRENEDVKEFYLGVAGEGRKSFKDVKHYKRRKRWLA